MKTKICKRSGHEIAWDGRTTWVNSGKDGMCIGRFTKVSAEVHHEAKEQMTKGECLDCFKDTSFEGWKRFKASMLEHYGAVVHEDAIPDYLADESARAEVEGDLHAAGIIEDPDIDGGLLG